MRRGYLSFFLLASFGFRVSCLLAQEAQKQEEQQNQTPPLQQQNVSQLKPVVVTAARMETPLQETAASVTVIGEEEIRWQQATTVADALRNVPGLNIEQSGSRGTTTGVFLRGTETDQTLVLIDGVEVNSVTLGSADFSNLTSE